MLTVDFSLLPIQPGERLLDMGCGEGTSSARLLGMGAKHVLGIDVSEAAITRARPRAVPGRLEFRLGDVTRDLLRGPRPVVTLALCVRPWGRCSERTVQDRLVPTSL